MVGVADGERVGERVVEGDVAAREVRHRGGALVRHPLVVLAVVPGGVRGGPVVRQVLEELQAEIRRAGMEGQDVAVGIARSGWCHTRLARGQL